MARRTLSEARSLLESTILPNANPYWTERYGQVLDAAEARAREVANQRIESDATDIAERIKAAQRELTEVRDELESLAAEGAEGRIDAATYARGMKVVDMNAFNPRVAGSNPARPTAVGGPR